MNDPKEKLPEQQQPPQEQGTWWRRFELIKPEQGEELDKLCWDKGLSRQDLRLILTTIKIKDGMEDTFEPHRLVDA